MTTVPIETPVTMGLVAGTCRPAGMNTDCVTVATDGLLLVSVTVTPPAGAGIPKLSDIPTVLPGATDRFCPRLIKLLPVTSMSADVVVKPEAVAVKSPFPFVRPLTVNDPDVEPAGIVTVAGFTVKTVGTLLESEIVTPPTGAA